MIWLILAAYLTIGIIAFRWTLRRLIRTFPDLGITALDLVFAAYCAVFWPAAVSALALFTADHRNVNEGLVRRLAGMKDTHNG